MAAQFNQHITDGDDLGAYDYGSIMHYPRNAFSANGQDTITPADPNAQIGQRTGLSAGDIAAVGRCIPAVAGRAVSPRSPRDVDPAKTVRDDGGIKKLRRRAGPVQEVPRRQRRFKKCATTWSRPRSWSTISDSRRSPTTT